MKQILTVYRIQRAQFFKEKGMLLYYLLGILLLGGIFPHIFSDFASSLNCILLLTIMLAKPLLADSIAMERQKKTLETILSSPITGKDLFLGKVLFCLAFAISFFVLNLGLLLITCLWFHIFWSFTLVQWIFLLLSVLFTFLTVCLIGVRSSAKSPDTHTANRRIALPVYLLSILLIVFLTLLFAQDASLYVPASMIFFGIHIVILLIYFHKCRSMSQADYYDAIEHSSYKHIQRPASSITFHSQFSAVLRNEFKYLMTLKNLHGGFLILTIAPAVILCLLHIYTGKFQLNYGIVVIALMMPRIPVNLVAYSVGGEKVYRTGESLLSTPLRTQSMLLAKSCFPVLVSMVILLVSSALMTAAMPIYNRLCHITTPVPSYTTAQILLLFPVCILSCILMIFLSAIFSLVMKTPRQGLYVNSTLSYLFAVPSAFILELKHPVPWAIVYAIVLLAAILGVILVLSYKVDRYTIMNKL